MSGHNPEIDYPGTLDGVEFNGRQYQVGASRQTGKVETSAASLVDVISCVRGWLVGAIFERFSPSQDPINGTCWTHLDEGVRVTGRFVGGQWED